MSEINPDSPSNEPTGPFGSPSAPSPSFPTASPPPPIGYPPQHEMPRPAISPPPMGPPAGPPGYGYGYQPVMTNPFDSRGVPVLVIAIVGFVVCQVAAPVAWVMGNSVMKEAQAAGWPEPTTNKIGRIMGIVGTALFTLAIVAVILLVLVGSFNSK
jgi:hypothetical protein